MNIRYFAICCCAMVVALSAVSHAQKYEWISQLYSTNSQFGNAVYAAPNGDVYVAGYIAGSMGVGNGLEVNSVGIDAYLVKYSSSGEAQWVRQASSLGWNGGRGITVDKDGNIFLTGRYQLNTTFNGQMVPEIGMNDVFVSKYDPNGTLLWVRYGGGPQHDWGNSVSVDSSGNCYITGFFTQGASFDGTSISARGDRDMFVASYSPSGTLRWVKSGGGGGADEAYGVACDKDGNAYVTGLFSGNATFDQINISSIGTTDAFVVKYSTNGTPQWVRQSKESAGAGGAAEKVGVDGEGNVYAAGWFRGTATFGDETITSAGLEDAFIAKYSPDGDVMAIHRIGGAGSDGAAGFGQGIAIAVENDGSYAIATSFSETVSIGETEITSEGSTDIFTASFEADGTLKWVITAGGNEFDAYVALGVDGKHNAYVFGNFSSNIFKCGTARLERYTSLLDIFMTKISPKGAVSELPVAVYSKTAMGFGDVIVGEKMLDTAKLSLGSLTPLVVESIGITAADTKGMTLISPLKSAFPITIVPGQELDIIVEFAPSDTGNVLRVMNVVTNDPENSQTSIFLVGKGVIPEEVLPIATVSETEIDFGTIDVGTSLQKSFTVSSGSSAELIVEGIELDGLVSAFEILSPDVSAFPITVTNPLEVTVEFHPTADATADAIVNVMTNDPVTPTWQIAVTGVGKEVIMTTGVDRSSKPDNSALSVEVFPNPIVKDAEIVATIPTAGEFSVIICDILGNTVATLHSGQGERGIHTYHVDLSGLSAGTYCCMVQTEQKRTIRMITIGK